MRSLPEKDFWDALRTRLRNYEEAPAKDDDWKFIAAAIKPIAPWYKRRGVIALVALLLVSGTVTWYGLPTETNDNLASNNNADNGHRITTDSASRPAATTREPVTSGAGQSEVEHARTQQKSSVASAAAAGQSRTHDNKNVQSDQAKTSATKRTNTAGSTTYNVPPQQSQAVGGAGGTARASASQKTSPAKTNSTNASSETERINTFDAQKSAEHHADAGPQQSAQRRPQPETLPVSTPQASYASTNSASKEFEDSNSPTSVNDNKQFRQADGSNAAHAVPYNSQEKQTTQQQSARPGVVAQSVQQPLAVLAQQSSETNNDSAQFSTSGKKQSNAETESSIRTAAGDQRQTGNPVAPQASTTPIIANKLTIGTNVAAPDTLAAAPTTTSDKRSSQAEATMGQATDSLPGPKDSTLVKVNGKQSVTAQARKDKEQKTEQLRPVLYFSLTPSLAFQKIMPLHNDDIHIASLSDQGMFSSNRMGISLETGAQFTVVKGLELYGGLLYYQQSQSIKYSYTLPSSTTLNTTESMDYVITPQGGTREFRYAMRNIGGSAGFLYTVKDAKLMHKIGAGVQYQYGLRAARSGDTYKNTGSQYLNYQVHYRLEWAAAGRTRLYVQPAFIHSVWTTENLREPLTIKPYRVAFTFGINVAF